MESTQGNTPEIAYSDLGEDEKHAILACGMYMLLEKVCPNVKGRIEVITQTLPRGKRHLAVDVYHDIVNQYAYRTIIERDQK